MLCLHVFAITLFSRHWEIFLYTFVRKDYKIYANCVALVGCVPRGNNKNNLKTIPPFLLLILSEFHK